MLRPFPAPQDTVIMREGEVGREMFVIVKGKVHVTKASCSLGLLPPGSFFGEMAIV